MAIEAARAVADSPAQWARPEAPRSIFCAGMAAGGFPLRSRSGRSVGADLSAGMRSRCGGETALWEQFKATLRNSALAGCPVGALSFVSARLREHRSQLEPIYWQAWRPRLVAVLLLMCSLPRTIHVFSCSRPCATFFLREDNLSSGFQFQPA